jgi:hypothetical protein
MPIISQDNYAGFCASRESSDLISGLSRKAQQSYQVILITPFRSSQGRQAPKSYQFRSLTNNFVKTTKYMTEESEHYTDRPKVHKSPATLLNPETSTKTQTY